MPKIKDKFDPSYGEFMSFTLEELKEWDNKDITFTKLEWFKGHKLVKLIEFIGITPWEKALFHVRFYNKDYIEVYSNIDK